MLAELPPPPPPTLAQQALCARVDAVLAGGRGREALALLPAKAADPVLGGRRARALLLAGQHDAAAEACWAVLEHHHQDTDAYLVMAWTYMDEGQYGMAHQPLETALARLPGFEPGWRELGRTFYWLKRYDRAAQACAKAVALVPRDAEAWRYRGLALGMGGQAYQGAQALTQVSALLPNDLGSRVMRGRFYLAAKDQAQAEVALRGALRLEPGDRTARSLLVRALREQGKLWQAFRTWWS